MGLIKKMLFLLCTLLVLYPSTVMANWENPVEILAGGWGAADTEFGISEGQYILGLPDDFVVLDDGKIVIADFVNRKLKIYGIGGIFIKSIVIPGQDVYAFDTDLIISSNYDLDKDFDRLGLYNINTESWVWLETDPANKVSSNPDAKIIVADDKSKFIYWAGGLTGIGIEYSATGEVLNRFSTRSVIFGKEIASGSSDDGAYHQIIVFENASYNCSVPIGFDQFVRDNEGYLYGIAHNIGTPQHTRVYKLTECGKIIGQVDFPADKETSLPNFTTRIDEQYGEPFFAPNGDVYTWKRTPEAYSILKWTWVNDPNVSEGPDMPEEVQALPSNSGIYLTWNPSPQDPGCVSGYEIERASTAGGPYSPVATVPLDEKQTYNYNDTTAGAGQTWYYRIRSASDIGNSDPVEVSAARP